MDNVESGKVDADSVVSIWLERFRVIEDEQQIYFGPDEWSPDRSYFDGDDEWDWGEFDGCGDLRATHNFTEASSEDRENRRYDE
jgi:hypothetical protein